MPRAKGIAGVDQHNIEITVQGMMLKTVIQDEDFGTKVRTGILSCLIAILTNQDGHARQRTRQEIGLIPSGLPVEHWPISCGDHTDMRGRACTIPTA